MSSFEDIRPYEDGEVAGVVRQLLADTEFLRFIGKWQMPRLHRYLPWVVDMLVARELRRQSRGVESIRDFQEIIARAAQQVVNESVTEFLYEGIDKLDRNSSYLFISNHRDIAGDSMLLNYALFLSGFETVRIAVGDNLVQRQFATDLMKLNKSFFIRRSVEGTRKLYKALMLSSEYIRTSLREGNSVWIAQSEGRAKNGMDRTDPAVIKMLTLFERKHDFGKTIAALKIVPVSLCYEYDPCDEMKACELTSVARQGGYEKTDGEDLISLVEGLAGFKGNVVLRLGDVLDGSFTSPEEVAMEVDRQIMGNFQLFPINYWALSQIQEAQFQDVWRQVQDKVVLPDVKPFEARLENCQAPYRDQWLKMYANPVVNKFTVSSLDPSLRSG